jgi:hypothetical protein
MNLQLIEGFEFYLYILKTQISNTENKKFLGIFLKDTMILW